MGVGARVFVPEDFEKDEAFDKKAASFLERRAADFLWVENPRDPYTAWNCASFYRRGSIRMGKYRIILTGELSRNEEKIVFQGAFSCGEAVFACNAITLDLTAKNGALSFDFWSDGEAFSELDAGLHYLMPLEDGDELASERRYLAEFYNSVFTAPQGAVFSAHLSPCELLNGKASYVLLPEEFSGSNFLTASGTSLTWKPEPGARLVFERTAHACVQEKETVSFYQMEFCLGYHGSFTCTGGEMVPGLFGGEFFSSDSGFEFAAGNPALLSGSALEPQPTTAWMRVKGSYYSSAQDSSLYAEKDGCFSPFAVSAADFQGYSDSFPMFPWRHAVFGSAEEGRRAEELLYRKRFQILVSGKGGQEEDSDRKGKKTEPETMLAVAPGGLCVGIGEDGEWSYIGLGNVSGGEEPDIRLTGNLGRAKTEFLNKECFLAAVSADEFWAFGGSSLSFTVDGWEISLPEDNWEDQNVMAIMKYSRSFSIAEKLQDNAVVKGLMESAYKDGVEIGEYHDFIKVMTDQNFEGLVLLNAVASAKNLPEEAAFVVSLVPEIRAVYTAINSSRITQEGGKLQIGKSAVSAFFHYQADQKPRSELGCFQTAGLSVQIAASRMVDFYSKSELFLPKILGERTNCCLFLEGIFEQNSGTDCFHFSLASEVSEEVADSMVNRICINAVNMLVSSEGKKFCLDGRLSFAKTEGCDLFSYDGLAFENLVVLMDGGGNWSEDLSGLRFIKERSAVREGSLLETFGACAADYYAGIMASPDSLGYSSINTPARQGQLEGEWNGVVFAVGIGSDGKLGDNALIGVSLLLAWCGKSCYFGVKETDLLGFSLSGVLGFGFGGLELVQGEKGLMLKFCSAGVRLFRYTLPRQSADLYVFGEKGKIGWYMGYGEETE